MSQGAPPCNRSDAPIYGASGCGSPRALVEAALAEGARHGPFDFILYSGDSQRHDMGEATNDTWAGLAGVLNTTRELMAAAFPGTAVQMLPSPVMGNNDFVPDYSVDVASEEPWTPGADLPPNAQLTRVAALWRDFLSPAEAASFGYGGYLVRSLSSRLTLLVLNTVVYSPKAADESFADPFGQFAWMRAQLEAAREAGAAVYVHGHVPPVYDVFGPAPMMVPRFIRRCLEVFKEYEDVIAAHLFGHMHSSELRALPGLSPASPPLVQQAAVAPCYGNRPALTIATYDAGGSQRLTDLSTRYGDLTAAAAAGGRGGLPWETTMESLLSLLHLDALTNGAVAALGAAMATDDALYAAYRDRWFQGIAEPHCQGACRVLFACLVSDGCSASALQSCRKRRTYSAVSTSRPSHISGACSEIASAQGGALPCAGWLWRR